MAFAYVAPLAMWALGMGPWLLLPLLTLPWRRQALRTVLRVGRSAGAAAVDAPGRPLGLVYAALLGLGLALPQG